MAVCFTQGIRTVIVGKPNVGKSTLMNLFSGYQRSIVTDIAGTTRDVIEEQVQLGDLQLLLSDTAGIRDTADAVEQIGVHYAVEKMEQADLILAVFDASRPFSEEDHRILNQVSNSRCLLLQWCIRQTFLRCWMKRRWKEAFSKSSILRWKSQEFGTAPTSHSTGASFGAVGGRRRSTGQ